jgi:hypothetical protein
MQKEFLKIFSNVPPSDWKNIDVTETYKNARRQCFENCERTVINSPLGSGYALHPLLLHGIAPWFSAKQGPDSLSRQVAYFRPLLNEVQDWLKIC